MKKEYTKFFWPDIRPTGYPVNETGYPAGYRIEKKAGYPAGRISGATLVIRQDKNNKVLTFIEHMSDANSNVRAKLVSCNAALLSACFRNAETIFPVSK